MCGCSSATPVVPNSSLVERKPSSRLRGNYVSGGGVSGAGGLGRGGGCRWVRPKLSSIFTGDFGWLAHWPQMR
jgi:hypothetical protein